MNKILIIDDDQKLQSLLREYFMEFNYTVFSIYDGNDAVKNIIEFEPDIIILDIMMPGKDGFEVLGDIRKKYSIPVIMLTARGEETDKIVGLEMGSDDYLSKPFNPRELLARIKAILRRINSTENLPVKNKNIIKAGNLSLDNTSFRLKYQTNSIELSSTEFCIMELLMKDPNSVKTRDEIMNFSKGRDFMAFERSIDVHISKLRSKVASLTGEGNFIKTIWGRGYMFVEKN
jgi:two-component system, OmpR family, phosphate regulon response regulator OmpR